MDVIVAAGLLDGPDDIILEQLLIVAVVPPAVAGRPSAASRALRAAQADADVVAPAQPRGQPQHLLLVAAVAVEEDQQRVRVVRLVAGRQEGADRQRVRGLDSEV